MKTVARIARIRQETPTVKSFLLELRGLDLPFMPGQWVDMYIDSPSVGTEIGGFSMTSSPLQKGKIEFAVKKISHGKVSVYLHERAQVGDLLTVDGGHGDFYFQEGMGDSLVLIAGGIGITPLMSIIRYVNESRLDVNISLLYSAGTPSELVFFDELRAISSRNEGINCQFTVTRPEGDPWNDRVGRIDHRMLEESALDRVAHYYICGPRGMAQDMAATLTGLGVEASRIKSEEW